MKILLSFVVLFAFIVFSASSCVVSDATSTIIYRGRATPAIVEVDSDKSRFLNYVDSLRGMEMIQFKVYGKLNVGLFKSLSIFTPSLESVASLLQVAINPRLCRWVLLENRNMNFALPVETKRVPLSADFALPDTWCVLSGDKPGTYHLGKHVSSFPLFNRENRELMLTPFSEVRSSWKVSPSCSMLLFCFSPYLFLLVYSLVSVLLLSFAGSLR